MKNGILNAVKTVYALTIAAFLIMAVAFGISAFYEPPEPMEPREPPYIERVYEPPPKECAAYEEWVALQQDFEAQWEQYNEENTRMWVAHDQDMRDHRRNVFLIAYPLGVLFVILGLELKIRLEVLKPGLVLGGLGIVIYAISQSDLSDITRFVGVAIGLVVIIYVGYRTLAERKLFKKEP